MRIEPVIVSNSPCFLSWSSQLPVSISLLDACPFTVFELVVSKLGNSSRKKQFTGRYFLISRLIHWKYFLLLLWSLISCAFEFYSISNDFFNEGLAIYHQHCIFILIYLGHLLPIKLWRILPLLLLGGVECSWWFASSDLSFLFGNGSGILHHFHIHALLQTKVEVWLFREFLE